MLDSFEIITTSGVVLWSRQYASVSPAIVDKFIKDVFIEENTALTAGGHGKDNDTTNAFTSGSTTTTSAGAPAPYMTEQYAVKWAFVKELGIIFVAVYKSLLHLSWIDKLVENIKTIFVKLYGDQLTRPNTTIVECARFDDYFDQQMNELEGGGGGGGDREKRTMGNPPLASPFSSAAAASLSDSSPASTPPIGTPTTSRPSTPGGGPQVAASSTSAQPSPPLSKISRRARKAQKTTGYSSDEAVVRKHQQNKDKATAGASGGKAAKRGRKWDANGLADEEADDDVLLDYSALDVANNKDKNGRSGLAATAPAALEPVDASTWGSTTAKGQFVLKDLDDEVHSILAAAAAEESTKSTSSKAAAAAATAGGVEGLLGSGLSTISGLFRNVVGGKTLTKADLDKAMKGMEEHLLRKNVAREAAVRLCESVEAELLGVKTGNFESINTRVRSALESALTKMLTPTSSLDLLREIDAVTKASSPRPYVLSIVGVNGVGKSTNLSKICFFLLQNRYRVLVAAGDTFRSGAVEQLAVHVRNLQELTAREGGRVELYQRGYGKDAATVAKDAVTFAAQQGFDVVLIDTAGRRHNDQRLMSSLEKFAKLARPDKILMVAEALVGTDSVAQARNFNAAFGAARGLDGFIISKCDTVGNMVGTLVSLVHATHVPILFVGVGQHYSDLRNFSVRWAVERLLSNE